MAGLTTGAMGPGSMARAGHPIAYHQSGYPRRVDAVDALMGTRKAGLPPNSIQTTKFHPV